MSDLTFLDDPACRDIIARLAQEAAKIWAPDELELAAPLVDAYAEQVRARGQILYPARGQQRPLGFGGDELWLLILLPILTGFLGNLLATAGVWTLHGLREKLVIMTPAHCVTPPPPLDPIRVQIMLQEETGGKGLNRQQVEQLALLMVTIMNELLVPAQTNGIKHGHSTS